MGNAVTSHVTKVMRNVYQMVSDVLSLCLLSNLSQFVALVFSQRWVNYEFFLAVNTLERTYNTYYTKMFYSKRNKMLLSGYWHKYWRTRENVLVIECIYLQILFRLSMKSIQYCILSLPNIWNYTCTNIFIMGIINLERK